MNPFPNLSRFAALSVITGSLLVAAPVLAAEDTANLAVSAVVSANCSIAVTPLTFGQYDPAVANLSAALPGTSTVSVLCTSGVETDIVLDGGANSDGGTLDAPVRRMSDGGTSFLSYGLFTEGGHTDVWGGTALTGMVHNGNGVSQNLTIYGLIPGAQNVIVGAYTDTVTATVTF